MCDDDSTCDEPFMLVDFYNLNLHWTSRSSDAFRDEGNVTCWAKHMTVALWCSLITFSSLASLLVWPFTNTLLLDISLDRFSVTFKSTGGLDVSSATPEPSGFEESRRDHLTVGGGFPPSTTQVTLSSVFSLTGMNRFPGSRRRPSMTRYGVFGRSEIEN